MTNTIEPNTIDNRRTATLRNMAEALNLNDWEKLERKELIKALKESKGLPVSPEPDEEPSNESVGNESVGNESVGNESVNESVGNESVNESVGNESVNESVGNESVNESVGNESVGIEEERVEIGSKAATMKEKLSKQPKVMIMIPLASGEKAGVSQSVILNGYRLNIRKGMYVEVPRQIAEIIKESQRQTILADNLKRMDGNPMKIEGNAPTELR